MPRYQPSGVDGGAAGGGGAATHECGAEYVSEPKRFDGVLDAHDPGGSRGQTVENVLHSPLL